MNNLGYVTNALQSKNVDGNVHTFLQKPSGGTKQGDKTSIECLVEAVLVEMLAQLGRA